jgi:hypothetical protein
MVRRFYHGRYGIQVLNPRPHGEREQVVVLTH